MFHSQCQVLLGHCRKKIGSNSFRVICLAMRSKVTQGEDRNRYQGLAQPWKGKVFVPLKCLVGEQNMVFRELCGFISISLQHAGALRNNECNQNKGQTLEFKSFFILYYV